MDVGCSWSLTHLAISRGYLLRGKRTIKSRHTVSFYLPMGAYQEVFLKIFEGKVERTNIDEALDKGCLVDGQGLASGLEKLGSHSCPGGQHEHWRDPPLAALPNPEHTTHCFLGRLAGGCCG